MEATLKTTDLSNLTLEEARQLLQDKKITSVALTEAVLARIQKHDGEVHAYLEVFDDALAQAKAADARIEKGERLALLGVPLAIKDNILIEGRLVSAGSKILEGYRATYDATVVRKLKEAGAVLVGRTNLDEFAMGSSTENSAYGVTKNPHDLSRVAGGSSGGSAAAVAYGGAIASLGSDTGGSVRQPAAFCGLVGLKPTYGSVSRFGLIAYGSSVDQIGPITKTVGDNEILYRVIAGYDPKDSTSIHEKAYQKRVIKDTLTIGVPRSFVEREGIDPEVLKNFNDTLEKLKTLGHTVVDITLPGIEHALAVYYILMPAEASANLARFDGMRYGLHKNGKNLLEDYEKTRGDGFGKEVKRRILLGTYILSAGYYDAYYNKANAARGMITRAFAEGFKNVDLIATPTAPTPAFTIGEKSDPLTMYLEDIFTTPINLSGVPAISLPTGTVERGGNMLPIGFQLIAHHGDEDTLFKASKALLG